MLINKRRTPFLESSVFCYVVILQPRVHLAGKSGKLNGAGICRRCFRRGLGRRFRGCFRRRHSWCRCRRFRGGFRRGLGWRVCGSVRWRIRRSICRCIRWRVGGCLGGIRGALCAGISGACHRAAGEHRQRQQNDTAQQRICLNHRRYPLRRTSYHR